MTELWEQHRPLVIALLVWAVGGALLLLAVHLPLGAPVAALQARGATDELRRFIGTSPPARTFREAREIAVKDGWKRVDSALAAARARVEFKPGPDFVIDPKAVQRAYEYTKVRDRVAAALRELANKAGVVVPAELDPRGDSKGLPPENDTDELLVRLAVTDRIVRNAVAAQVNHLAELRHELGSPRGVPLAERVVRVKLEAGLDSLVRFLEKCSNPPDGASGGVLVLRSADLSRAAAGSATLSADLTLAALTVVDVQPPKKADTRPPPSARRGF